MKYNEKIAQPGKNNTNTVAFKKIWYNAALNNMLEETGHAAKRATVAGWIYLFIERGRPLC